MTTPNDRDNILSVGASLITADSGAADLQYGMGPASLASNVHCARFTL